MNLFFFLMGLAGAFGIALSWPLTLLWVGLLAFGWGVLVIDL